MPHNPTPPPAPDLKKQIKAGSEPEPRQGSKHCWHVLLCCRCDLWPRDTSCCRPPLSRVSALHRATRLKIATSFRVSATNSQPSAPRAFSICSRLRLFSAALTTMYSHFGVRASATPTAAKHTTTKIRFRRDFIGQTSWRIAPGPHEPELHRSRPQRALFRSPMRPAKSAPPPAPPPDAHAHRARTARFSRSPLPDNARCGKARCHRRLPAHHCGRGRR